MVSLKENLLVSRYLEETTALLKKNSIGSAGLDSLILLEYVSGVDRAKILASDILKLTQKQKNVLNNLIQKRSNRIPITQLTKKSYFYGLEFYVDRSVMSPRPESEDIISLLADLLVKDKDLKKIKNLRLADIGCGSGAIGISIKKQYPKINVDLVDNNQKAIKIAKINVVKLSISAKVVHSDLLSNLTKNYHVIVANLPYVPDEYALNPEASAEPRSSIFGGPDGLNVYRKLFRQIQKLTNKPLLILLESFPSSQPLLAQIANKYGYDLVAKRGYIQAFKLHKNE